MPDLLQNDRLIRIYTPLGDNAVVVRSFEGTEEISRLFQYRIEIVSENAGIKASDLLGKRVTLSVVQADRSTERFFDGYVARFAQLPSQGRLNEYQIEIVPWLWFLTRTTNCRIFQQKTVPDVIEQIFVEYGFTNFSVDVSGEHKPWNYCVQYRETAFDFVSRLMEKEGIFYFFRHEKGKHTLVIGDKPSVYQPCAFQSAIRMQPADQRGALRTEDAIHEWERHYQYRTGRWTQTDYNYETPSTSLMANENTVLAIENSERYEFFDYPGGYEKRPDGERLTKLRMEEEEAGYDIGRGTSDARSLASGCKFTLSFHYQRDQNATYLLLKVSHRGRQGSLYGYDEGQEAFYQNGFVCQPEKVPFRPPRVTPKREVHGCQTAVVVGPEGEEIYTDSEGRVKVQFFWDREGTLDDKSSCWIRVSQPWAGKNWGAIWIPRIGQEVVVDFLEGDPDRPLIVGRVYNAQQIVPYDLPANSTQSGFKSRSSKGGGSSDFNELRLEDKKGSEEFFIHAQKDMKVEVEHDRSITVEHDETHTVQNDRTKNVQHDETTSITNNRTETVGQKETGKVGTDREWTIGSNDKLTVGQKQEITVGQEITIKAGQKITIQAGMEIQLMAGGNTITLGPSGVSIQSPALVSIQGMLVKIN